MYNYIFQKSTKVTGSILSLLLSFVLFPNITKSQPFFNKNEVCHSCYTGAYGSAIINNNNQLTVLGGYSSYNSNPARQWIFEVYDTTLTNKNRFVHQDSLIFTAPVLFFQNPQTNSYNVLTYYNIPDTAGWNGNSSVIHYKFNSSFNLFSRQIIDTFRFDKQDGYTNIFFNNNKIYCIGQFYDSTLGLGERTVGLKILDTNGTILQRNIYPFNNLGETYVNDVAFDGTNFYIVGKYRKDFDLNVTGNWLDVFVMKIDTLGNLQWLKLFPVKHDNNGYSIKVMPNGNIFFTGSEFSRYIPNTPITDLTIMRVNYILNSNGTTLFIDSAKAPKPRVQKGGFVFPRNDSTMMVLAYRDSIVNIYEDYIFQVTSNQGHILTEATHQTPDSSNYNNRSLNFFYSGLYYPPTKGYVMVGQSNRLKPNGIDSYFQPWILSVDSNGCINTGCAVPLATQNQNPLLEGREATIYPNPSYNGIFYIKTTEKITWKILNIEGKIITQGTQNNIDISNQPTGIYYLQLQTEKGNQTTKIIKE